MSSTHNTTATKVWHSLAGLLSRHAPTAKVALLGAPMAGGAVTPGACDRGPEVFRRILKRISTYDLETEQDLKYLTIHDAGDIELEGVSPGEGFRPIRDRFEQLVEKYELSMLVGGNNAITRPGVHAIDRTLQRVGLVTLDAHFDLRDTAQGLLNGNPVQALIDDGLPGAHIAQIGLAPFANAAYMHETAKQEGISVYTMRDCCARGIDAVMAEALETIADRCDWIYVDFDIDVIERGLAPGAPGARPGGMAPSDFFAAARIAGAHPKVAAVDLVEFDPGLDVSDMTALVAGRWLAEILTGFERRST